MPSRLGSACRRCGQAIPRGGECPACRPPAVRLPDRRGSATSRGYGSGHRTRFRGGVLRRDPICVICRARVATHADHWPRSRDELIALGLDPDDPQYGRGLCEQCDNRQTAQRQPGGWNQRNRGRMAGITVVYGPPCAGKTTLVSQRRSESDIVIDMDALARALGSPRGHDHDRIHWQAAAEARDALIVRYMSKPGWAERVWVIQTQRPDPARWTDRTTYVPVPTDRDTCHDRARRAGREPSVHEAIDRWWDAETAGISPEVGSHAQ